MAAKQRSEPASGHDQESTHHQTDSGLYSGKCPTSCSSWRFLLAHLCLVASGGVVGVLMAPEIGYRTESEKFRGMINTRRIVENSE